MKKLLALVLALVMSMSLVTISNAAFKDADKIDYKEAVDVMNAVGVFIGDEKGNFNAKENLTREQAAKIIAYLELGSKAADALVGGATFTDVASTRWSAGFVGYCAQAGVVAGVGNGKFDPAGQLTALQFGKMLLVELGYDAKAAGMVGADWAINTSKLMASTKLMDKIDGSVNQVLTREKAAQMCVNALKAPTVEYSTKGSSIIVNGAEINFGASVPTYVTNTIAKEQTISKQTLTNSNAYTIELGEKLFKDLKLNRTADDFGRPANEWFWKAAKVGTYADKADLSYTEKVKLGTIYSDLGLGEKVLAKNVTVYVDGDKGTLAKDISKGEDTKIGGQGTLTEVYYDSGDNTAVICHINYYIGEVQKTVAATASKDAYIVIATDSVKPDGAAGVENFTTDAKFDDDVAVYYTYSESADEIKSVAVCETVSGTVTEAQNAKTAKEDTANVTISEKYKAAAKFVGEEVSGSMVKYDYKVYLDGNNNMLKIEKVSKLSNEYALVRATQGKNVFSSNKAQVVFADGTEKVVSTAKDYNKVSSYQIPNNTIVTWTEEDGVYTFQPVENKGNVTVRATDLNATANNTLVVTNNKAGMTIKDKTINANSNTILVLYDKKDDSYTTYTGIKEMPSIATKATVEADVYYYCNSGSMATILFVDVDNDTIVAGAGRNAIYLAGASRSNLIQNSTGNYYEYNAIVDDEITTVKVDKTTKVGSKYAYELDGMFKSYNVNSKGVITSLTAHDTYGSVAADKAQYLAGDGLNKVSADYTVIIDTKASGKNATITCDEKATFYYVDKDGKITEITYKNVTKDENDKVYAFVDDYMVKQLVVFEVKDTAPAAGTFDPADPKTAGIVGTTVVIPKIDGVKVDNAANVLAKNGYTVTGLFGGTYWAVKDGTTYFFTESNPEYYTLTVNGTVVEYMAKGTASKISEKEFAAKYDTDGTAYKFVKGGTTYFFAYDSSSANAMTDGTAAVAITTGYVKVTDNTSATTISGVETATVGGQKYAKVNNAVTVEYTVAANTSVTLNYTVGGVAKTPITESTTAAGKVTFTVSGDKDIVLTSATPATTYGITYPAAKTENGVTMTLTCPDTAVQGSTVTVKAKLTGKATGGNAVFALSGHGIDTNYANTFTGVTRSAAGTLTVADNTDLGAAGLEVTFTFTMPASDATISIA
mgnify:CR=1 FL=1